MKKLLVLLMMSVSLNGFAEEAVVAGEAVVASEQAKVAESEIPLNLESNRKSASETPGAFRVLFTLSILGIVGTGAFFFIRKYKVPQAAKHQTQIKILQQHYLGPKKSLAIVRVAGESILIGVTDHNISLIKSLALLDDEIPEQAPEQFEKVLTEVEPKEQIVKNKSVAMDISEDIEDRVQVKSKSVVDGEDEFAISGIKDIVSKRLKGMRSFQ